jgi:hypothetical protein
VIISTKKRRPFGRFHRLRAFDGEEFVRRFARNVAIGENLAAQPEYVQRAHPHPVDKRADNGSAVVNREC